MVVDPKEQDHRKTMLEKTIVGVGGDTEVLPFLPFVPSGTCLALGAGGPDAIRGERYVVRDALGAGATGQVYLVEDRELGRQVAVKVLAGSVSPKRVDSFLREARMTAALDHPNIAPIYDVAATEMGQVWFSMRRIEGRTLAAVIEDLCIKKSVGDLDDLHQRVQCILSVGNALRAAHDKGILHRDVKPANIMLGQFGEVLLVDWGTASSEATPGQSGLVGTPLYMSPQQSQGGEACVGDDVYALGATLFELLYLRPPLKPVGVTDFWRRKAQGRVDALTLDERRSVPRHLQAICLRALAPKLVDRYVSVHELSADLARWQAGQSVFACRDTLGEWATRWWRQHGLKTMIIGLVCVVVLGLVAALYGERLKEQATWGSPIFTETFTAGAMVPDGMEIFDGSAELKNNELITTSDRQFFLGCTQRFDGPVAITYEGEVAPGTDNCDLSLIWGQELKTNTNGKRYIVKSIKCQFGAYDGSYTAAISDIDEAHLTWSPIRPEIGRRYKLRVEIIDDTISMWVDGQLAINYRAPFPLEGGYFGLYGYYPGKIFDTIRVYNLGVPEKLPGTAIGDYLASRFEYDSAIEAYRRVLRTHTTGTIANDARYRLGLCLVRQGFREEAFQVWKDVSVPKYRDSIALAVFQSGFKHSEMGSDQVEKLAAVVGGLTQEGLQEAVTVWSFCLRSLPDNAPDYLNRQWMNIGQELFPQSSLVHRLNAEKMNAMGEYAELIQRYPDQRRLCAIASMELGRPQDVLEKYSDQSGVVAWAMVEMGQWNDVPERLHLWANLGDQKFNEARWSEMVDTPGSVKVPYGAFALIALGRLAEARVRYADNDYVQVMILAKEARWDDLIERFPLQAEGYIGAGRLDEAARLASPYCAEFALALRADAAGDHPQAAAYWQLWKDRNVKNLRRPPASLTWMEPFWRFTQGETDAVRTACQQVVEKHQWLDRQRPAYRARYLLGDIDDATYLAQPLQQFITADLLVLTGARAELVGDHDQAIAAYREYLALPTWEREINLPCENEIFVAWRLKMLIQP